MKREIIKGSSKTKTRVEGITKHLELDQTVGTSNQGILKTL